MVRGRLDKMILLPLTPPFPPGHRRIFCARSAGEGNSAHPAGYGTDNVPNPPYIYSAGESAPVGFAPVVQHRGVGQRVGFAVVDAALRFFDVVAR